MNNPYKLILGLGIILSVVFPATAQRKGQIETGGLLSFSSFSDAEKNNHSQLFVQNWLGYHLGRDVGFDIEPGVNIDILPDSINVMLLLIGSLRFRLLDVSPMVYRKEDYWRREMDTTSIFANMGFGYWSDGYTLSVGTSEHHSGPALMIGIGTQSRFGRFSTLRIKVQYLYLISPDIRQSPHRSAFLFGLGFGTFIRG